LIAATRSRRHARRGPLGPPAGHPPSATREQIAQEIVRIRSMKFAGLSQRGLVVLARIARTSRSPMIDPVPLLVKRLKHKEGLFAKRLQSPGDPGIHRIARGRKCHRRR
jgi:hypothetical protein